MFSFGSYLEQWFANFRVHQNHLEDLFKHRFLGPASKFSDLVGPREAWVFTSKKFSVFMLLFKEPHLIIISVDYNMHPWVITAYLKLVFLVTVQRLETLQWFKFTYLLLTIHATVFYFTSTYKCQNTFYFCCFESQLKKFFIYILIFFAALFLKIHTSGK